MLNGYAALLRRHAHRHLRGDRRRWRWRWHDRRSVPTNGVAVTGVAGAASSAQYWRITTPASKTLTVKMSGGTGDADLYTRFGSRPTTSTYAVART